MTIFHNVAVDIGVDEVADYRDNEDAHFINGAVEEPLRPLSSRVCWQERGQVQRDQRDFALGADFAITYIYLRCCSFLPFFRQILALFSYSTSLWENLWAWF